MASDITLDMVREVARKDYWVYFVQTVDGGPIKIGKAGRVDYRIIEIQNMSPVKLVLLAVEKYQPVRGSTVCDLERTLHRRYKHVRMHGEWFQPTPSLLHHISRLEPIGVDVFTFAKRVRSMRDHIATERKLAKDRGYTFANDL